MDVKNEQRSAIKFCCWLKKSAAETVKLMHKVYNNKEWLRVSTIFPWHKTFLEGGETAALLHHVGQPRSICTEELMNTVVTIVREDHHITVSQWISTPVQQLARALDISKSSVHTILFEKLKMWRVAAGRVPCFLTRERRDELSMSCMWKDMWL